MSTLLAEADATGRLQDTLGALRGMTVACRGSKPVAALRKYGVTPQIAAREPFTSVELLDALESLDLAAVAVALVHYGERNSRSLWHFSVAVRCYPNSVSISGGCPTGLARSRHSSVM